MRNSILEQKHPPDNQRSGADLHSDEREARLKLKSGCDAYFHPGRKCDAQGFQATGKRNVNAVWGRLALGKGVQRKA